MPDSLLHDRGARCLRGKVWLEHALDLRRAGAALESSYGLAVIDEDERGNLVHLEPLYPVTLLVGIDAPDAQPISLLPGEMGEQALHASSRP